MNKHTMFCLETKPGADIRVASSDTFTRVMVIVVTQFSCEFRKNQVPFWEQLRQRVEVQNENTQHNNMWPLWTK